MTVRRCSRAVFGMQRTLGVVIAGLLQGARNSFINCFLDVVRGETSHLHVRVFFDGELGKFSSDFSVVLREADGDGFAKPVVPLVLAELVFVHEKGRVGGSSCCVDAGSESGSQRRPGVLVDGFGTGFSRYVADEAL